MEKKEQSRKIQRMYRLTPLQEGMLYSHIASESMGTSKTNYVIQSVFRFNTEVREKEMVDAFRLLSKRYDAFRTIIVYEKVKNPVQIVLKEKCIEYEFRDIRHEKNPEEYLKKLYDEDIQRGFNLSKDSLLRTKVIHVGENDNRLVWTFHHIIIDGWCLQLVYGSFFKYYDQLCSGCSFDELDAQVRRERAGVSEFEDYVNIVSKVNPIDSTEYWKKYFEGYENCEAIKPTIAPKKTESTMQRDHFAFRQDTVDRLKALAALHNVTLNTIAEVLWGLFLQKTLSVNDIAFCKVVSGRNVALPGVDNIVGLFINTIPVRFRLDASLSFSDAIVMMQKSDTDGNEYEHCALVDILRDSIEGGVRIDSLFAFENYFTGNEKMNDEAGGGSENPSDILIEQAREETEYPLTASFNTGNNTLNVEIMYNPNQYCAEEVENYFKRLSYIADVVSAAPNMPISKLCFVTVEEEALLRSFNSTEAEYEKKPLQVLFEEQAARTPDNTAAVFEEKRVSYRELNELANTLAAMLRENGVGHGDYVAILAQKSIDAIVAVCGIIKAGAVYVPIDANYPEERIRTVLSDCNPKLLLLVGVKIHTEYKTLDIAELWNRERVRENLPCESTVDDLAYIIYTSGTTGKPKGTMIEQDGVVSLVKTSDYCPLNEETVLLQTGQLAFDASTFEIWGSLLNGGQLHLISENTLLDISRLKRYIRDSRINTMFLTSALFNQVTSYDAKALGSLKYLMVGGEKVSEPMIKLFKDNNFETVLENAYGPTETTTFATNYRIDEVCEKTPIGKPISNQKIYMMNGDVLCGIGVPGELCIAGAGVARGYLNRPELTAEKFVSNPFGSGTMYRTGDLARWLPDGNIEYLGRIDQQVKIRGFRIELGEIESCLRQIPGVKDCAVIVRKDKNGDSVLCAYLVFAGEVLTNEIIREKLGEKLPDYMIPSHIAAIDAIPVNKNGKVNVNALQEITIANADTYVAPTNEIEKLICDVYEEILCIERIGIEDNFFSIGGDSIKAIRIVNKLHELGYEVKIKDILEKRTPQNLAQAVAVMQSRNYEQGEVTGEIRNTPILTEFSKMKLAKPNHFNQSMMVDLDESDDVNTIHEALCEVIKHHDVLRAVYRNGKLVILPISESHLCTFKVFDHHGQGQSELYDAIVAECNKVQSSFDLENGPLVSAEVFKLSDKYTMMLCIHHLVVDMVSWEIIGEDLRTAADQLKQGQPVQLPQKTASYQDWGEALKLYREKYIGIEEQRYWAAAHTDVKQCIIPFDADRKNAGFSNGQVTLDEAHTLLLKNEANEKYSTVTMELLLSALTLTVSRMASMERACIILEGHGREKIGVDIDVLRTVGWFTSMYPVIINCEKDVGRSVVNTKEAVRHIPGHGIGYGALYAGTDEIHDICFNYFGVQPEMGPGTVEFPKGDDVAPENALPALININCSIVGNVFKASVNCSREHYSDAFISEFELEYANALREIAEHCTKTEEDAELQTIMTPSDLTNDDISLDDFDMILSSLEQMED